MDAAYYNYKTGVYLKARPNLTLAKATFLSQLVRPTVSGLVQAKIAFSTVLVTKARLTLTTHSPFAFPWTILTTTKNREQNGEKKPKRLHTVVKTLLEDKLQKVLVV